MKRNLIYGLLISLFVCVNGMVGYGQTPISIIPNETEGTTIKQNFSLCSDDGCYYAIIDVTNNGHFKLNNSAITSINGLNGLDIQYRGYNGLNDFISYANVSDVYLKFNGTSLSRVTNLPCAISESGDVDDDDDETEDTWTIDVGNQGNVGFPDGKTFVDGVVKIHGVKDQGSGIVIKRNGVPYFEFETISSPYGIQDLSWGSRFYGNIALGNNDAWVSIRDNKLVILSQAPPTGPSLTISLLNKRVHKNSSLEITPIITPENVPDNYSISYEWFDEGSFQVGASETLDVPTTEIGSVRYRLVTTLRDENGDVVKTYTNYSKVTVIEDGAALYPVCSGVERWVSGSYFDTYNLCTDDDGNITIDLSDINNSFVYITRNDYYEAKGEYPSETISINNGSTVFCSDVQFLFKEAIECEDFIYKGEVVGNASPDFSFLPSSTITCSNMSIEQGNSQKQNRFRFTCESTVIASESIFVDSYNVNNNVIFGKFVSPSITLGNNNNSIIEINGCSYLKTDKLRLIQSAQNNIKVHGHVIADNINSDANIHLEYDGTAENNAIITVGSVNANIIVIGGEHTVVNLCENPNKETPDALGYFGGVVIYNTDSEDGWSRYSPVTEGDINHNDGSSSYWTYANKGLFNSLREIPGYASYSDCINEVNMAALLPIELVSFSYSKGENKFIWKTASETNNDYFVVEYSRNGKDWVECSGHVSSVSANGYSYSVKPNMSINNSLFSYFRLKQVDNNGAYSYSNVITVSFSVENPCSEEYESNKVQIREMGGKWFRVINGELIYCENDN